MMLEVDGPSREQAEAIAPELQHASRELGVDLSWERLEADAL